MTKKALSKILAFGISTIAITAVLIVSVFYSYFESQTKNRLTDVISLVEAELEQSGNYDFINSQLNSQTRVTLISPDGTVLADSIKDASTLENHSNREEVIEAVQNGEGSTVRKSETLGENTYYYARLLNDGNILRVSAQAQNVVSVLGNVFVYILLVVLFVIICSVFVSIAITKSIVKPIEELGKNLNSLDEFKSYKELNPFVDALKEQKEKQKILDKQKKQFTANVSHELKTPLTSIAGYAELIETGIAKEPDIKPFAATIRKQALRLVSLTEDIIQLSQLEENDETGIVFSSVDIYEVSQRCVEALSINAKAKGVTITLEGKSTFIRANSSLL
ncbi:MAG: histidine kinase dimerization/phospho-acceptor domain-containing protein, partial [Eubacterium sp.]